MLFCTVLNFYFKYTFLLMMYGQIQGIKLSLFPWDLDKIKSCHPFTRLTGNPGSTTVIIATAELVFHSSMKSKRTLTYYFSKNPLRYETATIFETNCCEHFWCTGLFRPDWVFCSLVLNCTSVLYF